MLGWCEHYAKLSGDGYLRASSPVVLDVDESGDPTEVSVHWADVNVETRSPFPPMRVSRTMKLVIFQVNAPMVHAGNPPERRLPPVTTKSVSVDVPVGMLGAVGTV